MRGDYTPQKTTWETGLAQLHHFFLLYQMKQSLIQIVKMRGNDEEGCGDQAPGPDPKLSDFSGKTPIDFIRIWISPFVDQFDKERKIFLFGAMGERGYKGKEKGVLWN